MISSEYHAGEEPTTKKQTMEKETKQESTGEIQQKSDTENGKPKIKFHSKAKSGSNEQYLSNFQHVKDGIVIDEVPYISVEHYYQSMKYKPEHRGMFKGLDAELTTSKQARSAGGKGNMRKMVGYGVSDVKWKGASWDNDEDYYNIRVMKKALWQRFKQDKRFREIILQKDITFEHYQKARGPFNPDKIPDWGAYYDKKHTQTTRGLNILGNLYNELNAFHEIEGYFEIDGKLNWSGSSKGNDLKWFPYPRNTYGEMRDADKYDEDYKKCGYLVKDSDVVHPYKDATIILHA